MANALYMVDNPNRKKWQFWKPKKVMIIKEVSFEQVKWITDTFTIKGYDAQFTHQAEEKS